MSASRIASASRQMRVSTVSRSSDSCSDLAARVSAAWRATWRACSSAARPRPSAAAAAAPNAARELDLGRARTCVAAEPAARCSSECQRNDQEASVTRVRGRAARRARALRAAATRRRRGGDGVRRRRSATSAAAAAPVRRPRLVHQRRRGGIAGRSGQARRARPGAAAEASCVGGVTRCHRQAAGRLYTAPTPGEVAEWLKALAC